MQFPDLAAIPVFADLSAQELDLVRPILSLVRKPAGSVILAEGRVGDEMFILVRGQVQISKAMLLEGLSVPLLHMESPRKVLAVLDGADHPLLGEVALVDSDLRSATVRALSDCELLATRRELFFDLAGREPAIGVKLLLTLGRRMAATIRRSNAEVVKLTTALALALRKEV